MKIIIFDIFSKVRLAVSINMLTYSFVDLGSDSLYEHLYKNIKKDIINGVLAVNEMLPSKRNFAKHLGISVITVENAYAQLIAEGYVYSVPKKGYFVADTAAKTINKKNNFKKISSHESELKAADSLSGSALKESFPFSAWARIMREVLSQKREELLTPSPSAGVVELRSAVAQHLLQFRGMHVNPENIIIGAGAEYLYGLLIRLLGRDKVYGLEDPGYKKIGLIYESGRVQCRYLPVGAKGIDREDLEKQKVDVVHISPAHHFPTGIITPVSRRYELLGWAAEKQGRYIIEDDYDSEFCLKGRPVPPMQTVDISEKVIYMNTFTKSLAPTIRISYMILPDHLLQQFYEKLYFYSCTVSNFEQYTLAEFISRGNFEKHINRMRIYYRNIRDRLIDSVKQSCLGSFSWVSAENAGLHFLLKIKTKASDHELSQAIKECGTSFSCLSEYYQQPSQDTHTLVVNYSAVPAYAAEKEVNMLAEALKSF